MNFSGATAVCMKNRLYQFVGLKGNKVLPVNFCYRPCNTYIVMYLAISYCCVFQ